jgi:hypothetical protein
MSEEIDKRVLRKYEIREKLGKGVRIRWPLCSQADVAHAQAFC